VLTTSGTRAEYTVDIWSGNHPFFQGSNSTVMLDEGRVNKFNRRFAGVSVLSILLAHLSHIGHHPLIATEHLPASLPLYVKCLSDNVSVLALNYAMMQTSLACLHCISKHVCIVQHLKFCVRFCLFWSSACSHSASNALQPQICLGCRFGRYSWQGWYKWRQKVVNEQDRYWQEEGQEEEEAIVCL